ncbi:MAG: hypothetical protein II103_05750, partial [Treponema sp.]|nr:hypothetical protein [Treponema sp.]
SSFRKAIEKAVSEGILSDYLSRKTREVTNMLCAKYDYKMDIAVKQEEAFEDGMEKGKQQKTIEAVAGLYQNGVSIEVIAKSLNMATEDVQKIINKG